MVARAVLQRGIPGEPALVRHLALWVAFLGAALAAREGRLLSLATGEFLKGVVGKFFKLLTALVTVTVATALAQASLDLVLIEKEAGTFFVADWPTWGAQLVLPWSFGWIALHTAWRASDRWRGRLLVLAGVGLGAWLGRHPELAEGLSAWPGLTVLVASTLFGGPLFAAIGGAALYMFATIGVPLAAVPAETYRMAVSPHLPAIPLFTLCGFLLAEGDAAQRLLRLFRAFFGWLPGGTAVVCAVLCAFLTVFTGGSGVTILVAGGLLLQALRQDGYREKFSLGLLTASGSLGLLLPPALPLILYGIVAQVPIDELFAGGLLPGLLMIVLLAAFGIREGVRSRMRRTPFSAREALAALWQAKFEVLLPLVVIGSIFSGKATLLESAALAAAYAWIVQVVIHRNLSPLKGSLRVFQKCIVLVGGVLLILGVSMGLTNYMVDEQIPLQLLNWVQQHIDSRVAFLLTLNVFLATVVVVPLIVPLGEAYGIDPIHLGILFVANLELGYLTPPVGLNLFLASYRFDQPLLKIYRAAVPMLLILGVGVLLITYLPWLTTGLVELLRSSP
jgi:tripartite ATP-independent transporter DctM subunit